MTGFEPGDLVRHPDQPDWGLGQVQSHIGARLTVNFEHAGKVVILTSEIELRYAVQQKTEQPDW